MFCLIFFVGKTVPFVLLYGINKIYKENCNELIMKRGVVAILFIICIIFVISFVSSAVIDEELHLNIQVINSSGDVVTGTFDFEFNISTTANCNNVVYTNFSDLTTDSRGIISYYLENVNLNFSSQYWLCYYRDDVLINASKIARTPYSFIAKNVSAEGIINDSNMNMVGYNVTASSGLFSWLGSLLNRITTLFVQDIDFTGMINGSGNINTTGNVTADFFFGNGADFNDGWLNGGVSISGGDLYAQTVWVYNLSSLSVDSLSINGSILPPVGFDNTFDIGNSSLRWKDLYLSGQLSSNGTGDNYFLGNLGIGTGSPTKKLDVRGAINTSGTIYINNVTDISTWETNVSLNYSEIVYNTWDLRWFLNSTSYNATTITTKYGTLDSGDISSIHLSRDGNSYNVSENAGANPFTIIINFTGVTNIDYIDMRYWYTGVLGHGIEVGLYDYGAGDFEEEYLEITGTPSWEFSLIPVRDPSVHIDGGVVSVRLRHVQNGIISHDFFLDYINLIDGFSTTTNIDHDGLSGRNDIQNHPWALDIGGTRNITLLNVTGDIWTQGINISTWALNVSLNYSEIVFDTWNALWSSGGTDGSFNSSSWNRSGTNVFLANVGDSVGIGTITPNQKLHVSGNVNITKNLSIGTSLVFVDDSGDMIFRI